MNKNMINVINFHLANEKILLKNAPTSIIIGMKRQLSHYLSQR